MINRNTIQKSLRGDRKAQYELYSYCYSLLMPVGIRYYGDEQDASSAVNMIVVQVLDKHKYWRDHVPFDAWVKRMYVNKALDHWRRKKKSIEVHQEWTDQRGNSQSVDLLSENHRVEALLLKIEMLPELQSTVFKLFAIEGYNHQEIGEILNIKEGHSRYLLHMARKSLQQTVLSESQKLRS